MHASVFAMVMKETIFAVRVQPKKADLRKGNSSVPSSDPLYHREERQLRTKYSMAQPQGDQHMAFQPILSLRNDQLQANIERE